MQGGHTPQVSTVPVYVSYYIYMSFYTLHGLSQPAASGRVTGVIGFHRRSAAQLRRPIEVRRRLPELRC